MKPKITMYKDRSVRALAGFFIVLVLILQKIFSIDLSVLIMALALNLFQYGISGWCPFCFYFKKIGWLQINEKESL